LKDGRPTVKLEYRDLVEAAWDAEGHLMSPVVGKAQDRSNRLLEAKCHVLKIIGLPRALLKFPSEISDISLR
jgi:hypothetical protein